MRPARAPGRAGASSGAAAGGLKCRCGRHVCARASGVVVRRGGRAGGDVAVRSGAPLAHIPRGLGAPGSSR
eukprot:1184083-Prymnesium_polylepis.1